MGSPQGRPEKPLDTTVRARAKLAGYLRFLKREADLTYEKIVAKTGGRISKATFTRAASGSSTPAWETVRQLVWATTWETDQSAYKAAEARALKLWIAARRATRAPYYLHKAPDPALIAGLADLVRALRDQHVWAGCPAPDEMARMAGPGELPSSTARRIIQGRALPVTPQQAVAFLKACYITTDDELEPWLDAAARTARGNGMGWRPADFRPWTKAHRDLIEKLNTEIEEKAPPLSIVA